MPTGTGKTVCLLALTVSYIKFKKPNFKLVYCTRTIVEMEKTLEELKQVELERKYREEAKLRELENQRIALEKAKSEKATEIVENRKV